MNEQAEFISMLEERIAFICKSPRMFTHSSETLCVTLGTLVSLIEEMKGNPNWIEQYAHASVTYRQTVLKETEVSLKINPYLGKSYVLFNNPTEFVQHWQAVRELMRTKE